MVTNLVAPYQSRGQFGTRDFDKHVWYLPIPLYDETDPEHVILTQLGKRAEEVADVVELPENMGNVTARRRIRGALEADGVAEEIELLVGQLLQ